MPKVEFSELPDDARLWVFASQRPLAEGEAEKLRQVVDGYLAHWAAHGVPLRSGRDLREGRFLAIAVDQRTEGASGCSIDGLFRALRQLEGELGTRLAAGGLVFVREPGGAITSMSRDAFARRSAEGTVTAATPVFDTAITTAGEYRRRFERPAGESWHAALLEAQPTR